MTADSVSEPAPDFVTPAVLVAMGSATVTVTPDAASKVSPYVPVNELPEATLNVSESASACTSDADASVTRPEMVLAPLVLRIAPFDDAPAPLIVIGSARVMSLEIARVAPSATVVPPSADPSAEPCVTDNVPAETVVAPS